MDSCALSYSCCEGADPSSPCAISNVKKFVPDKLAWGGFSD